MFALSESSLRFLWDALARYVGIPSINPAFTDSAAAERELASAVARDLDAAGLETRVLSSGTNRDSVVGRLPGRGGGRSLMLYAHLDTVGVGAMKDPFGARIEDGRMYGRGTYDMKAGLASCVTAARVLAERGGLAGDVFVVAVADEEEASLGMQTVLEHVRTDAAVITEPTELEICVAHKGFVWFTVTTHGRAAHGSRFEEGVDANLMMGRVLSALSELEAKVREGERHTLLGPGSLHVGTLAGGSGMSVYADRCELGLERRTLPGERPENLLEELRRMLRRLGEARGPFRAEARVDLARSPFEAHADSTVVATLSNVAADHLQAAPRVQGATYWMDAAFTSEAGIDTVVFGPIGAGAHADVEWVDLESVRRHCEILIDTASHYCAS